MENTVLINKIYHLSILLQITDQRKISCYRALYDVVSQKHNEKK